MKANVKWKMENVKWMALATLLLSRSTVFAEAVPAYDTLISHRGESVDAPENTLPACKTAVERGFGFECDVYLSKDGRVFTFHDKTLARTTGGANTNKCSDATWDEISQLDVGSWGKWKGSKFAGTRPALLEEVLALARDGRQIYVEVKSGPEIVPYIKDIFAKQTKATNANTLFISGNSDTCRALKEQMPDYKVYFVSYVRQKWGKTAPFWTHEEMLSRTMESKADGIDCYFDPDYVTDDFVKMFTDAGLEFHVWTVDDLDLALEAFRRGAKTVTTNCAKKLLDEYAERQNNEGQLGILTPPPSAAPRINGAKVFGVRPGHPILWRLPVTGERPVRLSATGLPDGATFNAERGILGGSVAKRGTYPIAFTAENAHGTAHGVLKLVVGDKIALTPPMGWNSWNCFNYKVAETDIRNAADALEKSGLADHGWSYVNIDDFWQNNPYRFKDDVTLQGAERKPDGTINPNARFPDMKGLADYIHAKGLKAGLYSSPGPYTCGMCTGSWGYEWKDAKTYAEWGYDLLKYDLCTYNRKRFRNMTDHKGVGTGLELETLPYRLMGEALKVQNRDIVFSLCNYGKGNVSTWGENVGGQMWRTGGDIKDSFRKMLEGIERQAGLWPYAHPGAWNDPDMLIVGVLGIPSKGVGMTEFHPSSLTHNEQYTHISLWAVLCSPLLIGCDMTRLDDFTLSLLSNDEVIEANQDELGAQAALVARGPRAQVWTKPMHDGSLVFALFNTADTATRIAIDYDSLGLEGKWLVRDLWRQKDEGIFGLRYSAEVPGHATHLVRLFPKDGAHLADGVSDIRMNAVYIQFEESRPVGKPGYKAPKSYPCERCGDK